METDTFVAVRTVDGAFQGRVEEITDKVITVRTPVAVHTLARANVLGMRTLAADPHKGKYL